MTDDTKRSIKILTGFPEDVVAIEATGHVEASDYEEVLIPEVENRIRREGKVKLLYVIGAGFKGFSAGAAWDDARLGVRHMGDFARLAVVSDVDWIRMGTRMMAPMLRCPVHTFHLAELEQANAWILSDDKPGGPEADVTRKLPLTEDMMPPQP